MNDAALSDALTKTLLEITAIDSPIGEEKALCDHVEARLRRSVPKATVFRFHDSLLVKLNDRPSLPKIALVGHLDTVRTQHDGPARIEGERLYGAGSADMKSGLAVMIELAERLDLSNLPAELYLVFYEREEGPFDENILGPMIDEFEVLRSLDLAICLEPSDNKLQLGCTGSVHATLVFEGRTAHSARPWQGDNAIVKAAPVLAELGAREPVEKIIDGLLYRDVLSPTMAKGGRSRNIVPDIFEVNVNFRFAPGRTPTDVVKELESIVAGRAKVVPVDLSPAGHPHGTDPLVKKLADSGVRAVEPKQAWTDVARFDAVGVKAVNFGPGTQAQAHQRNEYTELPLLAEGYRIIERFLLSVRPDDARR
ncbi:MAG: succinyl-diaminopimelate desuccinylase [Myxococcales bacterium]|nr:MAG: succinyl-diaminopimelate desuccinylase [Myxococcales bacterium]